MLTNFPRSSSLWKSKAGKVVGFINVTDDRLERTHTVKTKCDICTYFNENTKIMVLVNAELEEKGMLWIKHAKTIS